MHTKKNTSYAPITDAKKKASWEKTTSLTPVGQHALTSLQNWYTVHARALPWRMPPGSPQLPDPYAVLVSEIMLQQTTVQTAAPYYKAFLTRWPTVKALASASVEDVLHAWQGLGYYRRARSLHQTAHILCHKYNALFPKTFRQLVQLPGIGPYTAGALLSIAFRQPAAAVDGHIARIFARLLCLPHTGTHLLRRVTQHTASFVQHALHPGDYTQALMDLGTQLCTPQQPSCTQCPLKEACLSYRKKQQALFPKRLPKKKLPERYAHFFWVRQANTPKLFLQEEQEKLLHGLLRPLRSTFDDEKKPPLFPIKGSWEKLGTLQHTFTHFRLTLFVWHTTWQADGTDFPAQWPGKWIARQHIHAYPVSTLTKKVLALFDQNHSSKNPKNAA